MNLQDNYEASLKSVWLKRREFNSQEIFLLLSNCLGKVLILRNTMVNEIARFPAIIWCRLYDPKTQGHKKIKSFVYGLCAMREEYYRFKWVRRRIKKEMPRMKNRPAGFKTLMVNVMIRNLGKSNQYHRSIPDFKASWKPTQTDEEPWY